jgi:hypothetical protein
VLLVRDDCRRTSIALAGARYFDLIARRKMALTIKVDDFLAGGPSHAL